ncbi:hypothetical protein K140096H11_42600 [Bacteroides intestinalis]|uniref:Curli production assembly/transport component CsgG n=1 Tax=Bacteroides intestinalis TaxID=329854 RepID=A0A6N2W462_9BACE|nr:CsgG/HfaB family protein [Bacteroides intestinalis]
MKIKALLLLSFFIFSSSFTMGQTTKGYIISVENGQVYVDLTNVQVKVGDRIDVSVSGGYMTHPVTGKRIKKGDEQIGSLEIGETFSEYSVARPYDESLLQRLKEGMEVRLVGVQNDSSYNSRQVPSSSVNEIMTQSFVNEGRSRTVVPASDKVAVVVAQAQVNDVVNSGHFGGYVADMLMEQMLLCDKVRLLDRSVLNAQIDEINLAGEVLDGSTTIQRGKGIGARYILQTTMQKPDVANVRTGIPLASVMGAVQGLTGTNIGAAYASNASVATLKALVNISVRVVDLQTGEIVFMCSGSGKAQGKSQLSLEYGALGGGELNGGAGDFKQTVTGKAIQQAFVRIGRTLNDFFHGNTDKKVVGSVAGGRMNSGDRIYAKGCNLYLGTDKLDKEGAQMVFADTPELYFQYKKAKRMKNISKTCVWGGLLTGIAVVGTFMAIGDSSSRGDGVPIGGGIAAMGAISGIVLYRLTTNQVKKIVKNYNRKTQLLSFTTTGKGIGLCLTF